MRASLNTTIDSLELSINNGNMEADADSDSDSEFYESMKKRIEDSLQRTSDKEAFKEKLFKAIRAFLPDHLLKEDAIDLHQFSK